MIFKRQPARQRIFSSELRQDPITGDWIIVAPNRAHRPRDFQAGRRIFRFLPNTCPFCHLETQEQPILIFSAGKVIKNPAILPRNWSLAVVPNKFPAVLPQSDLKKEKKEFYRITPGAGAHEVVITRNHRKDISCLSLVQIKEVLDAYQMRILSLKKEEFANYIFVFHNYGCRGGASISHPHSQIVALSVADPDFKKRLDGAQRYWNKKHQCVHCRIIEQEKKDNKRIVFENNRFIAFCPFASQASFMTRIYPKKHLSRFEEISSKEKEGLAEALKEILVRQKKVLFSPSYNFFLATSPFDGEDYSYYHWYFEVRPRFSIKSSFYFNAGIELLNIRPEEAAERLRAAGKKH